MAEITGGELLLRCLHAEGVRHVNAITDGTYMMVIEALERLGDELNMRLVVPRLLGYKNAKYVERIELTDHPVEGFWVAAGYPYDGEVPASRLRPGKY